MAQNPLGVEVPAASDAFDPQGDMVELGSSLAGRVIVPVPNEAARLALLSDITPTADEPLIVRQGDTGWYWEHTGGSTWRVITGQLVSGTWAPATGWEVASPTAARWIRQGPRGELESAIIQRSSSSISIVMGTDYTVSTTLPPELPRPSRPQFVTGSIYFGTAVPWLARITVNTDGTITFRSETGGTLGVGGANIITMPPVSWVRDH